MAIYHTRVKTFSRAKGHASTAAAAYRAAQTSYNARAAASAQQVEAWANGMLTRYPVQADQVPAPVADQGALPEPVPAGPRPSP